MKRENQAEARSQKHIAILGAGPVGLELALAAAQSGLAFTVYEAASSPGGTRSQLGARAPVHSLVDGRVAASARAFGPRRGRAAVEFDRLSDRQRTRGARFRTLGQAAGNRAAHTVTARGCSRSVARA